MIEIVVVVAKLSMVLALSGWIGFGACMLIIDATDSEAANG